MLVFFGERTRECEQLLTPCERDNPAWIAHDMAGHASTTSAFNACGCLDVLEPDEALLTPRDQARRLCLEGSDRDPRTVSGPRRGRQWRRVELREFSLGRVEAADDEEAPDLEMPCKTGVRPVAALLERRPRRVERLRTKSKLARDERDLGLGDGPWPFRKATSKAKGRSALWGACP
jgi:hypothetical protein